MERKDEMILGSLLPSGLSVHPILLFPLRLQKWKINHELWSVTAEASCASNVAGISTSSSPQGWILQTICPKN